MCTYLDNSAPWLLWLEILRSDTNMVRQYRWLYFPRLVKRSLKWHIFIRANAAILWWKTDSATVSKCPRRPL